MIALEEVLGRHTRLCADIRTNNIGFRFGLLAENGQLTDKSVELALEG